LHDVISTRWGILLLLETEAEALRTARQEGGHHLGLQEIVTARPGGNNMPPPFAVTRSKITLEPREQHVGCDHKAPGSSNRDGNSASSTQQQRAASNSNGSIRNQAANGQPEAQQQVQQQQQPQPYIATVAGSSSTKHNNYNDPGWPALLAAGVLASPQCWRSMT
jgi:hypothetical protein